MILCAFAPGVGVSRQLSAVTEGQKLHTGVYRIINDQRQPGVGLHVCVNNNRLWGKTCGSASPTNQDVFVLHDKGDNKYIIQSLYNGQYVQDVTKNYVEYETGGSAAQFTILYQDKSKGTGISYFNIFNPSNGANDNWCWHMDGSRHVIRWHPMENGGISPCDFRLEEVTTMSKGDVREILVKN